MVVPVVAGWRPCSSSGLHPPGELTGLISRAVTELGAVAMTMTQPDVPGLWKELEARVAAGDRFAGLFATRTAPARPSLLSAHVATAGGGIDTLEAATAARRRRLSRAHPAAGRRVLVRAGDPRPASAWSPRAIPGSRR